MMVEHSEPLPGNLTRWPRPERRGTVGGLPTEFIEMTVTLLRQDTGFGFRIVGGTEEGSQVRPFKLNVIISSSSLTVRLF